MIMPLGSTVTWKDESGSFLIGEVITANGGVRYVRFESRRPMWIMTDHLAMITVEEVPMIFIDGIVEMINTYANGELILQEVRTYPLEKTIILP